MKTKGSFIFLGCLCVLFLAATQGYSSTISASAGAGGSIWPFGPINVSDGTDQTFTITPDAGYEILDVVTDSGSLGPVSSYTFINVTADDSITATFAACPDPEPVMLESTGTYYNTIIGAYNDADPLGDTILLKAGAFPQQNLLFDLDLPITLVGGYDCGFSANFMTSVIPGSLTISAGSVRPSNLVLSSPPACAPGDPNNFPTNPEICDGLDNDCDGVADNGLTFDNDHDGYSAIGSCSGSANDCNDNNSSIHPGAQENYPADGIDQDCDGTDLVAPIDLQCGNCHGLNLVNQIHRTAVSAPDSSCATCHAAQISSVLYGHYGKTVKTAGNNMTAGQVISCTSCHDWHDLNYYPTGVYTNFVWAKVTSATTLTCDTCHENRAAAHEAAHNNRLIDPTCAQCHTSDTTTLGQPGNGTLTSQSDIDILHRSDCSTCHDYTTPGSAGSPDPATVAQAIANGANGAQITCTTCHTVTHHSGNEVHYDPLVDTSQSSMQGCAGCHHDYDNVNGTSVGLGIWPAILFEHDTDGTKDGSTNTCMNCHAYDGSASPPLAAVQGAIAGGTPVTCANCHTDKVPDVPHGIPTTGKHPLHLAMAGVSCSNCHNTGQFPYFKSGTDANGDGLYDLSETDVCEVCHQDGNGNPASDEYKAGWSDPAFHLTCTSCHAAPPSTGVHLSHFNGTAEDLAYGDLRITQDFTGGAVSANNMLGCGNCHPVDLSFHGNGIWGDVEFSNAAAPAGSLKALSPNGSFDEASKTCSNLYCHSANSWTTDGPVPAPWPDATGWNINIDGLPRPLPGNISTTRVYKNVTWNSGATLACGGCHDFPPQTSAPANDGGAGDSHYWVDQDGYENLHANNLGFEPIGCRTCHYDTVRQYNATQGQGWDIDPATNRRYYKDVALYDKAKHVNGSVNVVFDSVDNFTYDDGFSTPATFDLALASFDPATKTCSNVGCHIAETQVKWGVPFRWWDNTECNRCHAFGGVPACSDCHSLH